VCEADHHAVHSGDLRAPAVVGLLGIGAIQSLQIVHAFESTPLIGSACGALIAACVAVAAGLLVAGDVRAWGAAGLTSVIAILGYALKHFVGTTFDAQHFENWRLVLDVVPLFVETAVLGLSGFAIALVRTDGRVTSW
jgi:hypothetical protein